MPVIWYFAPEGAKTFYGLNAFTSGNWDRDTPELPPQLGEQPPYTHPRYNGVNVWRYRGQCMIGTPQQFAEGLSAADLVAPIGLRPGCCGPVIVDQADAGVLLSASTRASQTVADVAGVLLSAIARPGRTDQLDAGVLLSSATSERVLLPAIAGVLLSSATSERVVFEDDAGVLLSSVTSEAIRVADVAGLLLAASTSQHLTVADVAGLLLAASTSQHQTVADVAGLLLAVDTPSIPPSVAYNGAVIVTGPKIFLAPPGPYPGVVAGVNVSGPGVPPGAVVLSLVGNIVNISAPATATTSGVYLFF